MRVLECNSDWLVFQCDREVSRVGDDHGGLRHGRHHAFARTRLPDLPDLAFDRRIAFGLFELLLQLAHQIRRNLRGFARIDVAFLFASGCESVLLHDPFDPIFPYMQQCREFAMAKGIILFMLLFDGYCHQLIFHRLLGLSIKAGASKAQGTGELAFAIGAIGCGESGGQFYLLSSF